MASRDRSGDDVRELLERMAEEMPVSPAMPPGLERRVRRRAARTVVAGALALLVLAFGGVVGVQALGDRSLRPAVDTCHGVLRWTPIDPGLASGAQLFSVTALSADDAWAVGQVTESTPSGESTRALILHWDGREWSRARAPRPGGLSSLVSVSAGAPDDVWAVGHRWRMTPSTGPGGAVTGVAPLAEHWDGRRWRIAPLSELSAPGRPFFGLAVVVAVAPDDVWVAGQGAPGSGGEPRIVAEHWDGRRWADRTPPRRADVEQFGALQVVGPRDVWLVGQAQMDPTPARPYGAIALMAERWDGTGWRRSGFPLQDDQVFLNGVAGVSPHDVWAVGTALPPVGDRPERPISIHWDGRSWREVPADQAGREVALNDVAAAPGGDVWAVGYAMRRGGPVVLHAEGDHWDAVATTTPKGPGAYTALNAVTALPDGSFVAVGSAGETAGGLGMRPTAIAGIGGCGK